LKKELEKSFKSLPNGGNLNALFLGEFQVYIPKGSTFIYFLKKITFKIYFAIVEFN